MNKTDELREELHKYLYKELAKVFETGTMQSRFDANNSEYHLPKIDLAIVPRILTEIDKYRDSAVSEQKEKDAEIVEMITPVIDCGKYPDIDSKIVADTNYQLTRQIAKAIREQ